MKVALDFCPTLTSFILIKTVVEHRIANPVVPSSNLGGFFFLLRYDRPREERTDDNKADG